MVMAEMLEHALQWGLARIGLGLLVAAFAAAAAAVLYAAVQYGKGR